MQIDTAKFRAAFTQRVQRELSPAEPVDAARASNPTDQVALSGKAESPEWRLRFETAVRAIAVSAAAGGIPGLAALAQDVGQSLVSEQEEVETARGMVEQFSSLPLIEDGGVDKLWKGVAAATDSPFEPPLVYESFFIDAQADARNIMLGTQSLKGDLADNNVLAFTLAHEEGHRQHRDTAGTAGLQALLDLSEGNDELYSLAFRAMSEGRQQNEREADEFAAEALTELVHDKQPILDFLSSMPGDLHHPPGAERKQAVDRVFQRAAEER